MLVVMQAHATEEQVRAVCQKIEVAWAIAPTPFPARSARPSALPATRAKSSPARWKKCAGVQEVIRVTKPYKLVSRDIKRGQHGHPFRRNRRHHWRARRWRSSPGLAPLRAANRHLRWRSAWPARARSFFAEAPTSPALRPTHFKVWAKKACRSWPRSASSSALRIVTEAIDNESLELVEEYADVIQIGARNMQNFSLLKRAGRARKPVLLKRGMSATLEELLMAAEYVMSEGNYNVILCERGVRTFADHTRNTLDLSIVPAVQRLSHLPIVVDPSHGTGKRNKVTPLSRAAVAVGADGLIVEVHHQPDKALSDGMQSLYPDQFDELMAQVRQIAPVVGRTVEPAVAKNSASLTVS